MPTMHYISREMYAEYRDVIDRLPGEMNDNSTGSVSSSNKRIKTTTTTTTTADEDYVDDDKDASKADIKRAIKKESDVDADGKVSPVQDTPHPTSDLIVTTQPSVSVGEKVIT